MNACSLNCEMGNDTSGPVLPYVLVAAEIHRELSVAHKVFTDGIEVASSLLGGRRIWRKVRNDELRNAGSLCEFADLRRRHVMCVHVPLESRRSLTRSRCRTAGTRGAGKGKHSIRVDHFADKEICATC